GRPGNAPRERGRARRRHRRGVGPCSPANLRRAPYQLLEAPPPPEEPPPPEKPPPPPPPDHPPPPQRPPLVLGVTTQPWRFRKAVPPVLWRRLRRIGKPTSHDPAASSPPYGGKTIDGKIP